jgi:hypothetical protein
VKSRRRLGEPAERAGTQSAENDAGPPRLAQGPVDAMRPPDAEHADHAAAADIDQVLLQQVLGRILAAALAPEQR